MTIYVIYHHDYCDDGGYCLATSHRRALTLQEKAVVTELVGITGRREAWVMGRADAGSRASSPLSAPWRRLQSPPLAHRCRI